MRVTSCSKQRTAGLEPLLGFDEPCETGPCLKISPPKGSIKAKTKLFLIQHQH